MTASELAFLALGLLLGAATGAALIVVLQNRAPRRAIRVTVTRDALPRRSETLSQDAFVTRPAEPARGGPGDRRWFDRNPLRHARGAPPREPGDRSPAPSWRPAQAVMDPAIGSHHRTAVPSAAPAGAAGWDPDVEDVRRHAATASVLERMLRGEHLAMVGAVDRIAGEDGARRRDWEVLLGGLVEAMSAMAVRESVIDFPMGTPFWDTFTIEQCRRVVGALGSMGYEYDGRSGWAGQRVPTYRELAQALANIGVDPRRVRAWPNQIEIAGLFVGARPAPEELLAAAGPDYAAADVRALIGTETPELAHLWLAWDAVHPVLFGLEAIPEPVAEA